MSTYAYWRLWVGVTLEGVKGPLPDNAAKIIDGIMDDFKPQEFDGMEVGAIHMHGQEVGLGVVVQEMSWGTEIDKKNRFDSKSLRKADKLVPRLRTLFRSWGIRGKVCVYHHIDLGG